MNTQFLVLEEGKVAYDDTGGDGRLVICVPGMGDLRGQYRFLAPQLAQAGYRVVSMDVRGHGESSVTWEDYSVASVGCDILDLTRWLKARSVVIIGNSMAAGAAVYAAAESPELVSGLVLLGPAVHGDVSPSFRLMMKILFARPWGPSTWVTYFKGLYPTRRPADFDAYTAALQRNLSEHGRVDALKKMMFASKAASEARLSQVKAPVLALMGAKDADFRNPAAEVQWVAEQVHGSYHIIAGAGHYPHAEMPEITAPLILAFLNGLQTGAKRPYAS